MHPQKIKINSGIGPKYKRGACNKKSYRDNDVSCTPTFPIFKTELRHSSNVITASFSAGNSNKQGPYC